MLKGSRFEDLHDKDGYKFFCFSNIFPYSSMMKKGERKYLLISSPSSEFINYIAKELKKYKNDHIITLNNMKFLLKDIEVIDYKIKRDCRDDTIRLITATPIIIRIPRRKYEKFNLNLRNPYKYIYWRKEHPIELFIEQLENNLYKKYEIFTGIMPVRELIIDRLMFKKQVSLRLNIHNNEHIVIGTLWEFIFHKPVNELVQFGLDCGFGERNSLGFGFMNLI
ncbi:MAG: CRISPR-associated endoribonuclease Cas6 [Candidatus Nitrosocaldus sp.]